MPVPPSRRLVLAGAATLAAAVVTGCGVRLEDDAPDLPFVPRREPVPAESALLAVLGTLRDSDAEHAAARAERLRTALEGAQVPATVLDDATAPTSDGETAAAFEAAVRECAPGMLRLVGQLTATHRIATPLGRRSGLWTPAGTQPWTAGSVAADVLAGTRAAVYALDVIAAKATGAVAEDALTAARALQRLEIRQTTAAGEQADEVTLGYERPAGLTGSKALEWGKDACERLLAVHAAGFDGLADDRDAALELVQWMVAAERISRPRFGRPVPELYGDAQPTT
ncbi:hypothetical protein [Janibacter terrae]|uniref:hypothetical protein n=1 Tax=Janibacter terrae TaxID=103817 RepID=UPI0031F9582F